jgi:hypothetical protein
MQGWFLVAACAVRGSVSKRSTKVTGLAAQILVPANQRKEQIMIQVRSGARAIVAGKAVPAVFARMVIDKISVPVAVAVRALFTVQVAVPMTVGAEQDLTSEWPAVA